MAADSGSSDPGSPHEAAVPPPLLPIPQANAAMQATFSGGSSASTSTKGAGKGAQRANMLQAKAKAHAALQAAAMKVMDNNGGASPGMASVASEAVALARGEIVKARAKPITKEQQQKLEADESAVLVTATARTFTAEEYEVLSDMGQAPASPENSMRNVRIEGAESQAKWFVEEGDEWKPFTRLDQRSLERAWCNPEDRPRSVAVQGGRAEVILGERLLKERYGLVPPQPLRGVRRSLWLRKENGSSIWEPFEESQDALLEEGYQELLATMRSMVQNAEDPSCIDDNVSAGKTVALPGEKQVHLKLRVAYKRDSKDFRWELAAEERSTRWWEKTTSILKAKFTTVRRGLKPSEVLWQPGEAEEEAFVTKPIERLYLVVHGGLRGEESLGRGRAGSGAWERARQVLKWCRDQAAQGYEGHGILAQCFRRHIRKCQLTWAGLRQLRRSGRGVLDPNGEGPWTMQDPSKASNSVSNCQSTVAHMATTATIGGVAGPAGNSRLRRDEVIEISWALSKPITDPLEKLACVSLPDAREAQMVASSAFSSSLLFTGGAVREAALSSVASAVEAGYELFKASNAEFEGSIKLVGHGVEGALLFELIRLKRLSFTPTALFLVGSPLGALLQLSVCAGDSDAGGAARHEELPEGFWLFNLFHPFDPHAYRLEPLMNSEMGELPMELVPLEGKQVAEKLSRAFDEASAKELEGFNHGVRSDWSLQGSLSDDEKARPLFFTHTAYLSSTKVAAFIQAAAHEIDLFGKKGSVEGWLEDLAAEEKEDFSLARSPGTGSEYSDPLGGSPSPKDPFADFRSRSFHKAQSSSSPFSSAAAASNNNTKSREQLERERRREEKMAEVRQLKEDYLESVQEGAANLKASFQQAFQGVRGALALKPSSASAGSVRR